MSRFVWGVVVLALGAALWAGRHRIARWLELGGGMVLVLTIVGCAGDPALVAVRVADTTAILQTETAPVLREHCVEPIPRLSDAELAELRRVCDPAVATYTAVRTAHVALRAALVAYAATQAGASRDALVGTLIRLAAELGVEAAKLATLIEVMR